MRIAICRSPFFVVLAYLVIITIVGCQIIPTASKSDQNRITVKQAEEILRKWVFDNNPDMNPDAQFPLKEVTTNEIWQRLNIQLFRLPDDHFTSSPQTFIISKEGEVNPLGCSWGGYGITQMFVTDLDANGEDELTYTDSCGSGMHRAHLEIFLPGRPGQSIINSTPTLFNGDFILEKVDDQKIVVEGKMIVYKQKKYVTIDAMVGELRLTEQNGQLELGVKLENDIPAEITNNLTTSVR